eukprot:TRINITY_DN29774_c0_g2_i1.p1 TRINITY_DN29774_c0_g2~~TRINITY_DN29774_c0_g2_i1.p1  ORF type:complete len:732 (-),score=153.28 TRINITY_DN29774_c0_g2_i1:276-2471(-)
MSAEKIADARAYSDEVKRQALEVLESVDYHEFMQIAEKRGLVVTPKAPPKRKEAENPIVKSLGGQEKIQTMAKKSKQVKDAVAGQLTPGEVPWDQDYVYKGSGLNKMLADASRFKKEFDALGMSLASKLSTLKLGDLNFEWCSVDTKSFKASALKMAVQYNGDPCQLTDIVRGTLVVNGKLNEDTLPKVYEVLQYIADPENEEMQHSCARPTFFADRYVSPLGDYRDWLFLLKLRGFICEMQVNLGEALKMKEGKQHLDYEKKRLANRKLLQFAMEGDRHGVELMLQSGGDPNTRDMNGTTCLHFAAHFGDVVMIKHLMAAGANILAADMDGRMPIFHALLLWHLEAASVLLDAMKLVPHRVKDAADNQKLELLNLWILARYSREGSSNKELCKEIEEQIYHLIGIALASVDDQTHIAASRGYAALCRENFNRGARAGSRRFCSAQGCDCSPLDRAVESGSIQTVEFLLNKGVDFLVPRSRLQAIGADYAMADKFAQMRALAKAADHLEAWDSSKRTSCLQEWLHAAFTTKSFNAALWLLEEGATLEDDSSKAGAFLGAAICSKRTDVIEALLEAKAPANMNLGLGMTALHLACGGGDAKACKLLLQHGASASSENENAFLPAHCAAQNGHANVMEMLHEAKADFYAGKYPVAAQAAMNGHFNCVELLGRMDLLYKGMHSPSGMSPLQDVARWLPGPSQVLVLDALKKYNVMAAEEDIEGRSQEGKDAEGE